MIQNARLAPFLTVLLLGACAPLATLQQVTTPKDLYEVTPKSTFDPGLPEVKAQLVVEEPTAASGLNTDRIAVKPNPYLVQYFPDSRWVDRAPLMVQTLLVESFENTGKVGSVGGQAIGLSADYTLLTDLREFQVLAAGKGDSETLTVQVRLNMKIVRSAFGFIIGSKSFSQEIRARSTDMLDVMRAFDAALGSAMKEAVEWSVTRIAKSEARVASNPVTEPPEEGL